jgi:hypothetical protein
LQQIKPQRKNNSTCTKQLTSFSISKHLNTRKSKWSAKQVTAKTLNLHNNIGEGIIAAVVIGKLAIFKPFDPVECNKPSISTFPSSLSNSTQINHYIYNYFSENNTRINKKTTD